MYNLQFWCSKEQQRRAQLLRKLASQVQRDSTEVGVAQQVIEIAREQFKDEEIMIAKHKTSLEFD